MTVAVTCSIQFAKTFTLWVNSTFRLKIRRVLLKKFSKLYLAENLPRNCDKLATLPEAHNLTQKVSRTTPCNLLRLYNSATPVPQKQTTQTQNFQNQLSIQHFVGPFVGWANKSQLDIG